MLIKSGTNVLFLASKSSSEKDILFNQLFHEYHHKQYLNNKKLKNKTSESFNNLMNDNQNNNSISDIINANKDNLKQFQNMKYENDENFDFTKYANNIQDINKVIIIYIYSIFYIINIFENIFILYKTLYIYF